MNILYIPFFLPIYFSKRKQEKDKPEIKIFPRRQAETQKEGIWKEIKLL